MQRAGCHHAKACENVVGQIPSPFSDRPTTLVPHDARRESRSWGGLERRPMPPGEREPGGVSDLEDQVMEASQLLTRVASGEVVQRPQLHHGLTAFEAQIAAATSALAHDVRVGGSDGSGAGAGASAILASLGCGGSPGRGACAAVYCLVGSDGSRSRCVRARRARAFVGVSVAAALSFLG